MALNRFLFPAAFALLLSAGCQPQASEDSAVPDEPAAVASGAGAEAEDEHAAHAAHAAEEGEGEALLPIMQRLGSEMLKLTHALMTDDAATVASSAEAIAAHAPISSEELERIRTELGNQMGAFEAVDESVHVASARLREIAQTGNLQDVVTQLNVVQGGCVSCHNQFRERLRTGTGEVQP